jgi:hypothetical protein
MKPTAREIDELHLGAHENGPSSVDGDGTDELRSGLRAWLSLGVELGGTLETHTSEMRRLYRRLQDNTPVDYEGAVTGTAVASTPLVLDLGKPDAGTFWEVRRVYVGGTDYSVSAAGTAGLYVSSQVPIGASPGGIAARDFTNNLPNAAGYGTHELIVKESQHLLLVVNGGTTGQQYLASLAASVFQVTAAAGRTETVA